MEANTLLWVTAIATALTALLTGTGGLAAWLAYRRERQRDEPIIERELDWSEREPQFLYLSLAIRNRLPERLVLEEVAVISPKSFGIGSAYGERRGVYGEQGPAEPSAQPVFSLRREVHPRGTAPTDHRSGDVLWERFALWPPAGWDAGEVRIQVKLSSKGGALKDRRIRMKVVAGPRVPVKPAPQF